MKTIIHHHIKYKEIHGVDEVVLMNNKDHQKLHRRLRKEGKCNIPPKILHDISHRSNNRRKYRYKQLHIFTPEKYSQVRTKLVYNIDTDEITIGTYFRINRGKHV